VKLGAGCNEVLESYVPELNSFDIFVIDCQCCVERQDILILKYIG
jgi:hypothetical protein